MKEVFSEFSDFSEIYNIYVLIEESKQYSIIDTNSKKNDQKSDKRGFNMPKYRRPNLKENSKDFIHLDFYGEKDILDSFSDIFVIYRNRIEGFKIVQFKSSENCELACGVISRNDKKKRKIEWEYREF